MMKHAWVGKIEGPLLVFAFVTFVYWQKDFFEIVPIELAKPFAESKRLVIAQFWSSIFAFLSLVIFMCASPSVMRQKSIKEPDSAI
jgi:hypothetical protein